MKSTKIVCTIGPASEKPAILEKMIKAGMNVARLNMSHGDYVWHSRAISAIRGAAKKLNEPVALLLDLQGPKVRIGELGSRNYELRVGKTVVLTTGKGGNDKIPSGYKNLHKDVAPGDRLLLDDGLLELRVIKITGRDIACEVITGGKLTSYKGINLPTASLSIPAITEKDKADLKFGIKQGVDWVALSFVKNAKEIYDLRYLIKQCETETGIKKQAPILIIAKIEKHEAIKNFDEILAAADGIMVARGDLGIEMPAEDVPIIQKMIIEKCLAAAKPVIVATQMLDSMIRNPRPTRAEVSDVANAVIDHTDAVMLSGETANGKYPLDAVETMAKIIQETEKSHYDDLITRDIVKKIKAASEAISNMATILARRVNTKLILAASLSGETGRIISRYRPELPILVATDAERVQRQLNLSWGVVPFVLPQCRSVEEFVDRATGYVIKNKFGRKGDKIVIIAGEPVGQSGNINLVEVKEI